jgi:hypothetical protein
MYNMEQGLLAAGLGTLCALCGYYIGRGNLKKAMEDATDLVLAGLAVEGIIKLTPQEDGDLLIEPGDKK